jgi:hypothetical protein
MEEIFWMVQQFTHSLFDARVRSHSHWRDAAERDISARYITPLYENADVIHTSIRQMFEALNSAKSELIAANADLVTAREQSRNVDSAIEEFSDYTKSAEGLLSQSESELQSMYGDMLNSLDLLERANAVGMSAPDETGNRSGHAEIHKLLPVYKATVKDASIPGLQIVDALVSSALGVPHDPNSSKYRVISDY